MSFRRKGWAHWGTAESWAGSCFGRMIQEPIDRSIGRIIARKCSRCSRRLMLTSRLFSFSYLLRAEFPFIHLLAFINGPHLVLILFCLLLFFLIQSIL
jgi:hypothetical protein